MEENSTLLRRMLHKAARAARSVALLRPSPPPTPATTPCRLPPSLLDCTDDDDDDDDGGSPSFHTAASTPAKTPLRSRLGSSTPGAADAVDVNRRAAEFIERFRRNASLELRYCSPSPVTPAMPPTSPDTYFNLSRLHGAVREHHDAPVRARPAVPYGRRSSPAGATARARASGMSIKWPSRRRPTVQV